MRIVVDATPVIQGHAGIGRYTEGLTRALLDSRLPDERWAAFGADAQRRPLPSTLTALPLVALPWSNKLWRARVALAHVFRQSQQHIVGAPDIFLASDFLLPFLPRARSVFILYDLTYALLPHTHSLLNRTYLQLMVPHFLRTASVIVSISQATRTDAIRLYSLPPERVHVVYGAAQPTFAPIIDIAQLDAVRQRYQLPQRFILSVGTLEPRKNIGTLLEAFAAAHLPEVTLVLVGRGGWQTRALQNQLTAVGSNVRVLGFVPDEDLPALYSLAQAFAFPSLYEGFGLPVIEALACGTPVLCSDTSSLPEVAGPAAQLLPPTDVRAWAAALQRVMTDATLRAELRAQGIKQAGRFSWEAAAHQVRHLYRDAASLI